MDTFRIQVSDLILLLEQNDLLSHDVSLFSPLRRSEDSPSVPLFYNSKEFDEFKRSSAGLESQGPRFVYFARFGNSFDGHALVEQVLSAGGLFIGQPDRLKLYVEKNAYPSKWLREMIEHPHLILVDHVESALAKTLEKASHLKNNAFTLVGVTGTNGKTSVVQIVSQMLENMAHMPVLRLGTLGVQLKDQHFPGTHPTMPDFPHFLKSLAWSQQQGTTKYVALEATSHGLHQGRLGNWKVDVAIFTNLTQDHLDYHQTMKSYEEAKQLLFRCYLKSTGCAVVNTQDAAWKGMTQAARTGGITRLVGVGTAKQRKAFFGLAKSSGMNAKFLEVSRVVSSSRGMTGHWTVYGPTEVLEDAPFTSPLLGTFQVENVSCATAALLALGFSLRQISAIVPKLQPIRGRLEKASEGDNVPTVVIDYAHTPDALEKTLQTCRQLLPKGGKLICVFGCGGDRDARKRPIMGAIAEQISDTIIVTNDNPRSEDPQAIAESICKGMENVHKCRIILSREAAIKEAIEGANREDIVVIAGKGHEDYQEIQGVKFPFDDRSVAKNVLHSKSMN